MISTPVSVSDMLSTIQGRLTRGLRLAPITKADGKNVCLIGESSGRIKWIQPSGAAGRRAPSPRIGHIVALLAYNSSQSSGCKERVPLWDL